MYKSNSKAGVAYVCTEITTKDTGPAIIPISLEKLFCASTKLAGPNNQIKDKSNFLSINRYGFLIVTNGLNRKYELTKK
jgi:hypothetical protein